MNTQEQPAVAGPVEPTVRPHRPHWTVRNCIWGGMAWTVSLTTPTKLELGSRLYSRAELDAMLASERERLARDVAGLHMAQSVNNQNHPRAWHDGVDAALEVIRVA